MPRNLFVFVFALLMALVSGLAISYVPDDLDFAPVGKEKRPPAVTVPRVSPRPSGQVHVIPSINYRMVYIPPGTFMMGSPEDESKRNNDETQHQVTLTRGYYMGVTEVTQWQWRNVMWNNPSFFKDAGDCPLENVSWNDVLGFIRRINQTEGTDKYRLPSEAEWEYACRAGRGGPYAGELDSMAWYASNSGGRTHPVAQKKPNAWGLYDMHGNVWEWCADWYGDYPSGPVMDPNGSSWSSGKLIRGGSWGRGAQYCRSANRGRYAPDLGDNRQLGFRLVKTAE